MTIKMTATAELQGDFGGATFMTGENYYSKADALAALKEWVEADFKPVNAAAITSLTITLEEI